ncbi:MAG: hydrogenase formation protein [Proteobacteria bacterium]|nr:hydrogenase formation protein [Pseudomonadota bacterium]
MTGLHALATPLRLRPGVPVGANLQASRPELAQPLAERLRPAELPRAWASVFNLCGHAHHLAATLALQALEVPLDADTGTDRAELARRLRTETLAEHTRRLHLDWPRLFGDAAAQAGAAQDLQALAPLLRATAQPTHGTSWATLHQGQRQALDAAPEHWLAQWQASPLAWLKTWSKAQDTWLARLLAHALAQDVSLPASRVPDLRVHAHADTLYTWARETLALPSTAPPLWQGKPAHTGCWTRGAAPTAPDSAALLLGARIAEWLRLAQPPTASSAARLAFGALRLDDARAVAWVEMARGLLLHLVQIDHPAAARVARYRIVAPTDWNFHPQGLAAQALATMAPAKRDATFGAGGSAVNLLMAALDPCLPFEIEPAQQAVAVAEFPDA